MRSCGQNTNADAAWTGIGRNLDKAIIRVYKNEINGGHLGP